jgi:hypothetical protein
MGDTRNTNSGVRSSSSPVYVSVVSFGQVQVRQHIRVLGDHPACRDSLPLGLSWERSGEDTIFRNVEAYQTMKMKIDTPVVVPQCPEQCHVHSCSSDICKEGADVHHEQHKQQATATATATLPEAHTSASQFARAKRLSFEERRELLMHGEGEAVTGVTPLDSSSSTTHSTIRRADSHRRRRAAMRAAIYAATSKQEQQNNVNISTRDQPCINGTGPLMAFFSYLAMTNRGNTFTEYSGRDDVHVHDSSIRKICDKRKAWHSSSRDNKSPISLW